MAEVVLENIVKRYGDVVAVNDVSLTINDGEFISLVGPSGCGKTTTLNMIAGLLELSEGSIYIGGRDVSELDPKDRDIAMVFQNYALYPNKTVYKNLAFPLEMRRLPKSDIDQQVRKAAETLSITPLLERKPRELSGGQQQRVALGRALVRNPKAFLMDEPLSNLDAKLRVQMRAEIARLHERLATTTLYVTHDQVEAMTLGQRVAVLRDGYLQQVDTPQNLFHHPANLFVAAFIGSPSMNLVEAQVSGGRVRFAGQELVLPEGSALAGLERSVILGIRPSDFAHADAAHASWPRMQVVPAVVEELGAETNLIFPIDAPRVQTDAVKAAADTHDDDEGALLADDQRALFTARIDGRRDARPGQPIEVALDVNHLHAFDPESGETLARERATAAAGA